MSDEYRISKSDFTVAKYDAVVPKDVVVLTAGLCTYYINFMPVQHITVVGWNKLGGARVISSAGFTGRLTDKGTFSRIKKFLDDGFDGVGGRNFPVRALAVNATGQEGSVYDFADEIDRCGKRSLRGTYAWAVKSATVERGKRLKFIWPFTSHAGLADSDGSRRKLKYFSVDLNLAKDMILRTLRGKVEGGPYSSFLIPDDINIEDEFKTYDYLDRLVCEERVSINLGSEWRPTYGKKTSPEWTSLVLAFTALKGLQTMVRDYFDLNVVANRLGVSELFLHNEEKAFSGYRDDPLDYVEPSSKSAPETDTEEALRIRKLKAETELAELQLAKFKRDHYDIVAYACE